jgi:HTH-type transcriptional regulator / antitoxin HigA
MNSAINETYGSLLMQTRPHIIRDNDDNERCIDLLETLVSQNHLTPEQEELVGVLRLLIHDYEKRFVIDPGATQADIVQHLMKANHLSPKDMEPILGTKSAVSMVLSGERPLSKAQIKRLSERFHVSAEVFFQSESKGASMQASAL